MLIKLGFLSDGLITWQSQNEGAWTQKFFYKLVFFPGGEIWARKREMTIILGSMSELKGKRDNR